MENHESSPLEVALKEAEKGAAKSGGEAEVGALLECARKEIAASSLKSVWQDAAEFGKVASYELSREVYERAQRRMADSLGVPHAVDGHVVGHALMRAAEGAYVKVVRRLRAGQMELKCSVLGPRFLAFALLKSAEVGNYEIVQELLRTTSAAALAMAGHELAHKAHADSYPFSVVSLTKDWHATLRHFKLLLPPASYVFHADTLSLQSAASDQETVHESLRSCYQLYALWRLTVVAAANGHGGVFRDLLTKRDDLASQSNQTKRTLMGHVHLKISELTKARSRIDDEFLRFVTKITAKLGRDTLLYEVYKSMESAAIADPKQGTAPWRCTSKAQFGLWEVMMDVPVLLMEHEGSYQNTETKKKLMRKYHYIKPVIPQIMKLNVQFKVIIDIQPNYCELTVGVNHVRVTVENQCWEESQTGHFPTRVSLSVTPVASTLTSVTMTGSSTNTAYKVGVGEQVRIGVQASLKAAPTAGISFQAMKATMSKVEGRPWRMEQLPIYNERGGSFTWSLLNLHGASFDRLSPMLQEAKKSVWQFGKRVPINPLLVLPFGTNGGVNFTGTEFDDTLSWRFANDLENSMVQFNVEGQVHTTHITQDTFWETRVVPFEVKLEQKLEACGDPAGADKKKKKKKK